MEVDSCEMCDDVSADGINVVGCIELDSKPTRDWDDKLNPSFSFAPVSYFNFFTSAPEHKI